MTTPKNKKIDGRFFIIGSARSGTTLLQAMLASHSEVYSFPESHFFCKAAPRGRFGRRLGIAKKSFAGAAMKYLFDVLQRPDLVYLAPSRSPFFRNYGKAFVCAVDTAAVDDGKRVWVEKTPHHIDFIDLIEHRVENAKFVHILRDGRDVVASQVHATLQDPEYWGNWAVKDLVAHWNADAQVSLRYQRSDTHLLVSYETLIKDPVRVLRAVAEFMEISFQDSMLRHWESTEKILGKRRSEPWMQMAFQPVEDRRQKKFMVVFSDAEREYVQEHLRWGGEVSRQFEAAGV